MVDDDDDSEFDSEAEEERRHAEEEKKKAEKARLEFLDTVCVFIAFIIILGASAGWKHQPYPCLIAPQELL